MNEAVDQAQERDQFYNQQVKDAGMPYGEARSRRLWPMMKGCIGKDILNTIRANAAEF